MKNWYKISKKVNHDYSWVYINLPSKIQDLLLNFGKEIDPDDLYKKEAEDGIETEPHITVKYALKTDDVKDIKEVIKGNKKGKFYLGESSVFETDKYDVVKIEVESEDLKEIHEDLNKLPHEDKYPEYHAHATIAYLKKGKGKKYIGKFKINKSFKFDELFFGDTEKEDHKIKLAGDTNMKSNWYKMALIVEKGQGAGKGKAYPICAWCGKFGTTPTGSEGTGEYIFKDIKEFDASEKKQFEKIKPYYDLFINKQLTLDSPVGFTHGICPYCSQHAF